MEPFVIQNEKSSMKRIIRASVALYFLLFCGYLIFTEASATHYGTLFYSSVIGASIALIFFLNDTLWFSTKAQLTIDETIIESNIRSNKFKLEWVKVSKVSILKNSVIFLFDGEKKQKELNFLTLSYQDVVQLQSKIIEICNYKNIPCSTISL